MYMQSNQPINSEGQGGLTGGLIGGAVGAAAMGSFHKWGNKKVGEDKVTKVHDEGSYNKAMEVHQDEIRKLKRKGLEIIEQAEGEQSRAHSLRFPNPSSPHSETTDQKKKNEAAELVKSYEAKTSQAIELGNHLDELKAKEFNKDDYKKDQIVKGEVRSRLGKKGLIAGYAGSIVGSSVTGALIDRYSHN